MKIAIIDYETGNLKSVSKALELASNNVLKNQYRNNKFGKRFK